MIGFFSSVNFHCCIHHPEHVKSSSPPLTLNTLYSMRSYSQPTGLVSGATQHSHGWSWLLSVCDFTKIHFFVEKATETIWMAEVSLFPSLQRSMPSYLSFVNTWTRALSLTSHLLTLWFQVAPGEEKSSPLISLKDWIMEVTRHKPVCIPKWLIATQNVLRQVMSRKH